MRIALTVDQFDTTLGGEQVWVDGLARFLSSRNHDVHVVTFLDRSRDLPATVHLLSDPGGILPRAILVDQYLKTLAADAVHDSGSALKADIYQPACGSALYSESRFIAACETSLRLRAAISPRAILRRRQLREIESKRVQGARRIIVASRLVADLLEAQHRGAAHKISIVPNGISSTRFNAAFSRETRDAARTKFQFGADQIIFLMVANNVLLKGADIAIEALARLRDRGHANARLVVAGGLPGKVVQRTVRQTGTRDAVTFLGYVPGVPELMAASDVFVHPTRWDTCSLVTSEAMASGLPVITSGMNGAAELIADGHDGFVIADPVNIDAVAASMARLMDPALRKDVGDNGRRRIEHLDIGTNCAEIERQLVELAGSRR